MKFRLSNAAIFIFFFSSIWSEHELVAQTSRIKDLVNIRGFRNNPLTGFGVVVGLNGTGDSPASLVSNQAVSNMFTRMGIKPQGDITVPASMAAVIVTADLPAFARSGDQLDIKIAVIGDAKSLAGGSLITTPLRAGDGNVYAIGQGAVIVGQAKGSGTEVLTVARIPGGATIEREFAPTLGSQGRITLSLKQPDFTTNVRLAEAINTELGGFFAKTLDPVTTEVTAPLTYSERIPEFISLIEGLLVESDQRSSVVMNERTGTIVMGADVRVLPIAIAHGQLSISVGDSSKSGKPAPKDGKGKASVAEIKGSTVGELVESLNAMGVKPADLISIMQTIHASGALKADLKFL